MMHYCVRQLTGKYKYLSEEELQKMREAQIEFLSCFGEVQVEAAGASPLNMPLWREVEFWEQVIEFEMEHNPDLLSRWFVEDDPIMH